MFRRVGMSFRLGGQTLRRRYHTVFVETLSKLSDVCSCHDFGEGGGYGGGFAIRPDYVDADFVRDYCEDKSSNDTSDLEAIANANSHDDRGTGGL